VLPLAAGFVVIVGLCAWTIGANSSLGRWVAAGLLLLATATWWLLCHRVLGAIRRLDAESASRERLQIARRAEAQVIAVRAHAEALIANAPAAMAMFDREMRYVVHSQRWLEDYRLQGQTILGRSHYEVFPEITEEWKAIHRGCLEGAVERSEEVPFDRADGQRQWLRWDVRSWRDERGEIGGIVMMTEEITERKKVEDALREATARAEAASLAKSDFLATMSHEIRTPMSGVVGFTSLLLETDLDARQREYTQTIRSSSETLLRILNDILDYSKIEAGHLELEDAPFDPSATTGDVIELLSFAAGNKQLELVLSLDPATPPSVVGDPARFRQVVLNLLGNAIKFTESGAVGVRVELVSGETPRLRVAVVDSGIGIAAEKQGLLFRKFSQVDASTSRKFGGTGLGLAISRELVELMGGEIGVESALGAGSMFWFMLPVRLPVTLPVSASATAPALALEELAATKALSGRRVLIVDDLPAQQAALAEHLSPWGIRSVGASSGIEALALLRSSRTSGDPFDLVLIDEEMPGLDGPATAKRMDADPTVAGIPRLLMSATLRTAPLEFADVVVKPIARPAQLHDALVRALKPAERREILQFPVTPAVAPPNAPPAKSETFYVLLAEDNPVNQKLGVRMLERLGCRVDVANDGREAVEKGSSEPYDMIFMDGQMPLLDGFEATRKIRAREAAASSASSLAPTRRVPIIALTASAMQGDRERCLEAGMDDYATKPLRLADLQAALARWSAVARSMRKAS